MPKGVSRKAELLPEAQRLRADGHYYREIAEQLGVAIQTVSEWFSDPDRAKINARRKRYGGICVDCGKPTDGSNGPRFAAERCRACDGKAIPRRSREYWAPYRREIETLRATGKTARELCAIIGIPYHDAHVARWRARGYCLPYRRTPEQVARIKAASSANLEKAREVYAANRVAHD